MTKVMPINQPLDVEMVHFQVLSIRQVDGFTYNGKDYGNTKWFNAYVQDKSFYFV